MVLSAGPLERLGNIATTAKSGECTHDQSLYALVCYGSSILIVRVFIVAVLLQALFSRSGFPVAIFFDEP